MSSAWIKCWRPRPNADVRLFAFGWSGGGASAYRTWHESLPPEVEVCAVQLPGREERISEKPFDDLGALTGALAKELGPKLDRPSVFFGHSVGAVVAFELAAHLVRSSSPVNEGSTPARPPRLLMLSARPAPQALARFEPIHALPPAKFLDAVTQRYRAIPAELLREAELMEAILPGLRADFTISDRYRQIDAPVPIPVPILVLGGRTDAVVLPEELEGWRCCTSKEFHLSMFEGGHFYLNEAASKTRLLAVVARALGELIG